MTSIQAVTYPIDFNEKGYTSLANLIRNKQYSTIFIVVDDNTITHCYPRFIELLETDKKIEVIQIDAGEIHKNLETCAGVWSAMTELGADRKSVLITLGGGVITDLGGFVASTFKRGIDFVNIPTTLLSMVDASVGGKTGVDLGVLKNQIGLFANPQMVVLDPEYLQTLSPREIRSGTAEIIKYGMTHDVHLYNEIKSNPTLNIIDLIHRSIEIKNEVVLEDPKEHGVRKALNWGHTIGHGIESYFLENAHKDTLTHGEAIAIGMVCEAYLSAKVLNFPSDKVADVKKTILAIYGKTAILEADFAPVLELMKHDKKNIGGEINFVLLNDFGDFKINCTVTNQLIIESLQYYNS
ncbi:3-dehydroquinate synthase [Tenacibaculum finnmarkense genomovar finnmarkense]|uniref:3-dehydroquinate synthase n=1 Tax=Tenacibaculum finnmarkense genomovar finnmarkense TaxID=1458503 RepID=A0AAP1WGX0_9FLAO|nr:3-dehydroquinate synthase [Tenacibaculum finnmarkense]MBE7653494.1 3-dehydroquinate synthase [Tenacibaculum finnmarkense genomovar finnmarkense]MBE7661371.1 3-dehydroquinate synthase [Tenacibaculum finnmarkense genomovar finnmarkense]MBE7692788.1 3-dehydroquinate synthase [Tenacibaculum finnmarkense genomovar finnmarkense]MBE7695798.1 3-dehydroquinate synthase [Tenacibaculum finnmarkense genomovar finnmarkense]MCD8418315.1 3-dehydroquinate synthase [Tenacibaculum finnmarkense genomovar finn